MAVLPDDGTSLKSEHVQAYLRERTGDFKVPKVAGIRADLSREDMHLRCDLSQSERVSRPGLRHGVRRRGSAAQRFVTNLQMH